MPQDSRRGALDENLVVAELLRACLNRSLRPELFFYRDSHGNEVDVVIRVGRDLVLIEIKSAGTFDESFHRGIARFREAAGSAVTPGAILYNGDRELVFRGVRVLNPLAHEGLAALAGVTPT